MADLTQCEISRLNDTPARSSVKRQAVATVLGWLERLPIWKASILVFFASLAFALLMTHVVRPLLGREAPFGGEPYDGYIELARNLAQGHGYVFEPGGHKVFHRPPLYPVLLVPGAMMPQFFTELYVAILNSALLALSGALVYFWGKSLLGKRTAALGWLIFMSNPFVLVGAKNPLSAICQMFAYSLLVYWSWSFYRRSATSNGVSASMLAAGIAVMYASVMSHGTMIAVTFLILSVFVAWGVRSRRWQTVKQSILIASALVLLIAPWTWRNYKVTGMFMPIAGNSGLAYFAGNAHWGITKPPLAAHEHRHEAELRHIGLPPERYKELISFYGFTSPEAEKFANSQISKHVREHPGDFARKVVLNVAEYYWPVIEVLIPPEGTYYASVGLKERIRRANPDQIPLSSYTFVLLLLAAGGLITLWRIRAARFALAVLVAVWALYAVPYFPFLTFVGHSHYNYGTLPVLSLLAAAFLLRKHSPFEHDNCH